MSTQVMKRGMRIEYAHAFGKVVAGKIIRAEKGRFAGWFVCRLFDEAGEYSACCWGGQLRVIDNGGR